MNIKGLKRTTAIFSTFVSVFLVTHYVAKVKAKGLENSRHDSCGNHDHAGNGHKKCSCQHLIPSEVGSASNGLKDYRTVNLQESMNGGKEQDSRTAEILKSLTREIKEISF